MRTQFGVGLISFLCTAGLAATAHADPVELTQLGTPYTQDFDGLASASGSSPVPAGWGFVEGGTGGNATYRVGTGSDNAGDTYSFGTAGSTDRAFGTLVSSSVKPIIGASFQNKTGATIHTLEIAFTGEQWRLGATGREDRLEFSWSLSADALNTADATANWASVPALNFIAPINSGSIGAVDGNAEASRTAISVTLTDLDIPADSVFWIRWTDFDPSGSDDGLAIDNFSLTPNPGEGGSNVDFIKIYDAGAFPQTGDTVTAGLLLENGEEATLTNLVVTDVIPAGLDASDEGFYVDLGAGPVMLTTAEDDDAGEIVDGVVTVRVGDVEVGGLIEVGYAFTIGVLDTPNTFSSEAVASYTLGDAGASVRASDSFDAMVGGTLNFVVFFDTDGDGQLDDDEDGLPGWSVLITNSDVIDTNDAGVASFTRLVPGDFDVLVEAAAADGDWNFTAPTTATVGAAESVQVLIAVTCTCNDNNVCTTSDTCFRGECSFGAPLDCGASDDPCVENSCDPTDGCGVTFTTAACEDGDDATRNDTCDGAGTCEGETYTCTPGVCEESSTPNGVDCDVTRVQLGTVCDDGDVTTRDDYCGETGPCTGIPYTCEPSGNPCVAVTQNGVGCVESPINAGGACDDGWATTRDDVCDADGVCAGTPYECPTSTNPCIANVPDGATCVATPVNVGNACDDGVSTTRGDVCGDDGTCAGTTYECEASTNACIVNVPNGLDCTPTPVGVGESCDDGLMTTRNDVCNAEGVCAGTSYNCTPSTNPCIANVPNGTACTPTPTNIGGTCDDGSASTRNDVCGDDGACAGETYECPTSTNPCMTNVANGTDCTATPTNAGGSCDDGSTGTRNDVCDAAGTCAGTAYTCDPSENPCATNVQDGTGCVAVNANEGESCNDGSASTRDDVCTEGTCAGTTYTCEVGPCDATATPNGTGCDYTYKEMHAACDDGDDATRNDMCDGASTCAGEAYTCTPGACEETSVPNGTDCTVTFKAAETSCDDGSACTTNDVCNNAGLCEGEAVTCDDGFSCDPTGECISTHCTACGDDNGCSNGSSCIDLEGETGKVCLLGCDVDDDCGEEQVCRALGEAGMFCFDLDGQCEAPPVEPGPDAEVEVGPESVPVEPGPESDPVEPGPEVVEAGPDAGAEIAEGEVIWSGGGSGCGGGTSTGAGILLLSLMLIAWRASKKRVA